MKDLLKLVLTLTLICSICSALLAAVYKQTEKPIAESLKRRTAKAAALVLPPGSGIPVEKVSGDITYYEAVVDGKPSAWAFTGRSKNGYGGPVSLMVGLDKNGTLISFEVLQSTETPGLGTKIDSDGFRKPLCGKAISGSSWTVKKDGGDVDAITAATISSRAALDCIRDAIAQFKKLVPQPTP